MEKFISLEKMREYFQKAILILFYSFFI